MTKKFPPTYSIIRGMIFIFEYLANSNLYSKIFLGVNQGPIWGLFMRKKNSGRKSRASIPLSLPKELQNSN
jgi:hypothetical protein